MYHCFLYGVLRELPTSIHQQPTNNPHKLKFNNGSNGKSRKETLECCMSQDLTQKSNKHEEVDFITHQKRHHDDDCGFS
jgi:hypothetical protein